jgi:predicted Rossmann fold nucleotide-binding protein DprA/Smf involved in DNA uptake
VGVDGAAHRAALQAGGARLPCSARGCKNFIHSAIATLRRR